MKIKEAIWRYLSTIGFMAAIPALPIPLLVTPFLLWFHRIDLLIRFWGYAAIAWLIIFAILWVWGLLLHVN